MAWFLITRYGKIFSEGFHINGKASFDGGAHEVYEAV
jgi:hypothetical protein